MLSKVVEGVATYGTAFLYVFCRNHLILIATGVNQQNGILNHFITIRFQFVHVKKKPKHIVLYLYPHAFFPQYQWKFSKISSFRRVIISLERTNLCTAVAKSYALRRPSVKKRKNIT